MILTDNEKKIYELMKSYNKGEIINHYLKLRRNNKVLEKKIEIIKEFWEEREENGHTILSRMDKMWISRIFNDR